jgi:hypothetical protein
VVALEKKIRKVRVAQTVEVLRYEPVASSIPDGVIGIFHCGPEVDLACNRNEYQGFLLGVKTTFR